MGSGFDSFVEMKRQVQSWMDRPDLAPQIEDFIRLGIMRISRKLRWRFIDTETTGVFVAGEDFITLPTDCLTVKYLRLDDVKPGPQDVDIVSFTEFSRRQREFSLVGTYPRAAFQLGLEMKLSPTPAAADNYTLWYSKFIPAWDESLSTTDWLLLHGFDAVLWAALSAGADFEEDETKKGQWERNLVDCIGDLKRTESRHAMGGGPLQVRPDVVPRGTPSRV